MNKTFKNVDTGVIIYIELPEKMRVATKTDFMDERGVELVDVPFLAKSFHFNQYELHTSKAGTIEKWKEWLDEDHLYIRSSP